MGWIIYWLNYDNQDLEKLRCGGFSRQSIIRLCELRKTYGHDEMDQPTIDRCHLEFARWLVETGRLSEENKEEHGLYQHLGI